MKNYNAPIDGKRTGEPVPIDEIMHYTYYNALYLFIKTKNSPKNLKKFRYKSVGESIVWSGDFEEMHPTKILLFYAAIEEIKKINPEVIRKNMDSDTTTEELIDIALRLSIIGHITVSILKKRFFDFLPSFGEGGDALRSLLYVANSFAIDGRVVFFWNEDNIESSVIEKEPVLKDMSEYLGDVIEIFEDSKFFNEVESFVKESAGYIEIIEKSGVLSSFYSIKDSVFQMMVDPTDPDAFPKKNIIFFDRFPFWVDVNGDGSMFSFLFQEMLDEKTREFILILEYSRLITYASKENKKKIRDSSFNYILKMMIDRNASISGKSDVFDKDFRKLSEILLSGGTIQAQRNFFALAHNKRTIQRIKLNIEREVVNEGHDIEAQLRHIAKENDGLIHPTKVHELMKLFFINVMEKLEKLLIDEGHLVYEDFTDEEIQDITLETVMIIQDKIPDIISRGGVERNG